MERLKNVKRKSQILIEEFIRDEHIIKLCKLYAGKYSLKELSEHFTKFAEICIKNEFLYELNKIYGIDIELCDNMMNEISFSYKIGSAFIDNDIYEQVSIVLDFESDETDEEYYERVNHNELVESINKMEKDEFDELENELDNNISSKVERYIQLRTKWRSKKLC